MYHRPSCFKCEQQFIRWADGSFVDRTQAERLSFHHSNFYPVYWSNMVSELTLWDIMGVMDSQIAHMVFQFLWKL